MAEEKTDHSGYRQRILKKYLEHGINSLDDKEMLDALLFTANSRQSSNDISKSLIEKYGSIKGLLNADYDELIKMDGISSTTAALICFMKDFSKNHKQENMTGICLVDSTNIRKFCYELMKDCEYEEVHALFLDQNMNLIVEKLLFTGGFNMVHVEIRTIVEEAIHNQCSNIILAHCHPHGIPKPSFDDITSTRKIAIALHNIGINLTDHIIVGENSSCSMRTSGIIMDQWENM